MSTPKITILQIIPAVGFEVVLAGPDVGLLRLPLACWALVEDDDMRVITGVAMMPDTDELCFYRDDLIAYIGPGQEEEPWMQESADQWRDAHGRKRC